MDSKYDNTNKGVLFHNNYKEEGDRKPDFTGNLNVEGKEYKIKSWKNVSRNGNDYLSLQIEDPEVKDKEIEEHKLGAGFAQKDTKREQQEEQITLKTKDDDLPF